MEKNRRNLMRRLFCAAAVLIMTLGCLTAVSASENSVQIDLTASAMGEGAEEINNILSGAGVSIAAGMDQDKVLINVDAGVMGQSILRALMEIGQEAVAFSLPDIDDSRYEYSVAALLEKMKANSYLEMFLPGAGNGFNISPFPMGAPEIAPEVYEEAVAVYGAFLGQKLQSLVKVEDNVPVSLPRLGEELTGSIAVLEPTAEELADLISGLADLLETDEATATIVNGWIDYIGSLDEVTISMIGSAFGVYAEPEELAAQLRQTFTSLPGQMHDAASQLQENGMNGTVLRLTMSTAGAGLSNLDFYAGNDQYGEYYEAGFEFLPAEGKTNLCLYAESQDEKYDLTIKGNTSSGNVSARVNGGPVAVLTYSLDSSNPSFLGVPCGTCVLNIMGMDMTLVITNAEDGSDYMLMLNGLDTYAGEGISGLNVNMHAGPGGVLQAPEGTLVDLSRLTDEEMLAVFQELAGKLAGSLGNMFG